MGKSRASNAKAKKAAYCGECIWIWIGTKKEGTWVRDPLAQLLGIGCSDGCVCVDANTLGIKGKLFDRLIVLCKDKKEEYGCSECSCTFMFQAGAWALVQNNCGTCGGNCACTPPDQFKKWGKVTGDVSPFTTIMVTWCH
jgi:hypothetical protein